MKKRIVSFIITIGFLIVLMIKISSFVSFNKTEEDIMKARDLFINR